MVLPLLAATVLVTLFLAWLLELRYRDETLPALSNRALAVPFVIVIAAALLAIPIALWPLASLTEWPRSTQVAWTAVDAADPATGALDIGGAEHSAVLGWPNGDFWPEVRLAREPRGVRLSTLGGGALIRVGGVYLNGTVLRRGGGGMQIGNQPGRSFSIELARSCWLCRTDELRIARTRVSAPLAVLRAPPVQASRAHVLGTLLAPSLNDLRRGGTADPAMVEALEEWAGTVRVLRASDDELRIVQDGEAWHVSVLTVPSTIEIVWPRRKLIARIQNAEGTLRLSFEPPWTRSSSLPPMPGNASALSFAREPEMAKNTFLLPLGYGAADFRRDEPLQLSPDGLPRFRNGADAAPRRRAGEPSWLQPAEGGTLARVLAPNRALSWVRVPLVIQNNGPGMILTITMLRDLPTPRALLIALVVAWGALVLFVASIAFGATQRLRVRDFWCLGGIAVAVWAILLFRVLLAVRFVLSPTAVDDVTMKGLAGTLAATVIVPGLMALSVRLWLHHRPGVAFDRRESAVTVGIAIVLAITAAVELVAMPRAILPNLAGRFATSVFDRLLLFIDFIAAVAAVSALRPSRLRSAAALLWQWPYRVTFEAGRTFWRALGEAASEPKWWKRVPRALWAPGVRVPFLVWVSVAAVLLALSVKFPEYVQQIAAPFWLLGVPALVLLARPLAGTENALRALGSGGPVATEPTLPDTIGFLVLMLFVPVALMLAATKDFGAIYAVLAFWLPLALLLLLTPASRMAAALLIIVVAGVVLSYRALVGTYTIAPGVTEHILSRVEVMRHGPEAQSWLLDLEAPSAGDAKSVTAANVRNALVHQWEHMAMVRKGGWLGLGYNRAPASQSFIRQDTIQYDSVFSFFVAGEHGLVGGLLLLFLFATPAIVLLLRRSRLNTGDVLALTIAAAFAGEALTHAAMNVSQLWFSGRDLPLLATSSNSDLLRWALLLALMAQALLWSSRLEADSADDVPETAVTRRNIFDETFGYTARRRWKLAVGLLIVAAGAAVALLQNDWIWFAFALAVPLAMALRKREYAALALLPALLVAVLVVRGALIAMHSSEYDVLTWSRLLGHVDELSDDGTLRFDPATKHILFHGSDRPAGATLLEAEVLRFNALPESVRVDGGRASLPGNFFDGIHSPGDYYTRMYELWRQQSERERRLRPSVFAIDRVASEGESGDPEVAYQVRGNPDFNVVHSFVEELHEEELQPVAIRGRTGPVPVLGRAWAMGRWVYAPSGAARALGLGWVRQAGEALFRVQKQQRTRVAQLTLDADLQREVQTAVEAAGRDLFSRLIAQSAPAPLPPRVAFTIVRATNGETLAMGSWPRASSDDRWRPRMAGWRELEPPLSWLGGDAPRALASRHAVDHNFTAIEMGSAGKPFWATAVLTEHPMLDRLLVTRNGDCDAVVNHHCVERQMFGRQVANKGWQVSPSPRWIDFSTYLASSDNRYHTRLGLLGLANESPRGNGIANDGRGASPGGRESLTGAHEAWNRFPAFPESTELTRDRPDRLADLQQQRVATLMRDLFDAHSGAAPPEGELRSHLLSFWSGNEDDDLRSTDALEPLTNVSPQAVDLRLGSVHTTRELVAILLGGASSRWSNIGVAAAFSSWAMHRPVVAHVVEREGAPLVRRSRAAAFDDHAAAAARKLRNGLHRVVVDGTASNIRGPLAPLAGRYEIYAKTGTLSTTDRDRPTSRIMMIIVAADANGNVQNAITLSFVAERSSLGFATGQIGQFVARHQAELEQLLAGGGR
jgi:hypothetical protein